MCLNFPHIQLYKHTMATMHFFKGEGKKKLKRVELEPLAPVNASAGKGEPDISESPAPQNSTGSLKTHTAIMSDL